VKSLHLLWVVAVDVMVVVVVMVVLWYTILAVFH
jgi:hypothetical protein